MGVPSALILRDPIPSADAIAAAVAARGAAIRFPAGIDLAASKEPVLSVRLDGKDTAFDFLVSATAGADHLPDAIRDAGSTILYFEARAPVSRRAVDMVREAIASLVPASTWFESLGVLIDPDGTEYEVEDPGDMPFVPPPPPAPTYPALRPLFWVLDHWLVSGLVGGVIAIAIGKMIGGRH